MKKTLIDSLINLFIYSGIGPFQYRRIKTGLQEENRLILQIMSPIAAFIFLCLVIGAFFNPTMMSRIGLYGVGFAAELVIFSLAKKQYRCSSVLIVIMVHVFNLILYAFGFAMDIFSRPNDAAVTYVVIVVICQLVFNMRPIESSLCSLTAMLLFLIVGSYIKSPSAKLDDLLNLTSFWGAGVAINLLLSNIRAKCHWGIVEQKRQREELSYALKAADEANKAKTAFLSNMSHDIRTPMNAIIGYTTLMGSTIDPENETQNNYLEKIKISSSYLLDLLDNVLEMSRIESGRIDLEYEPHDIRDFLDSLHIIIAGEMRKKNLVFQCEYKVQNPYAYIDPVKLREVLLNILSNSVKYTPAGRRIALVITEIPCSTPGYVTYSITVSDNGIGIGKEFLPHLFESFSRERDTTESHIAGSGLGMGIVKRLTDLMGGSISVESEVGKGTTITLELTSRMAERSDIAGNMTTISEQEVRKKTNHIRILLAEDNDMNAEITIELLQQTGMMIERAANGAECLEMLKNANRNYYDLILMDIQMPVMDGCRAAELIRAMDDPVKKKIPIIAMTANAFSEDRDNACKAGINGYVTKPINLTVLIDSILGALG